MKIAFVGKGGAGKSTLATIFSQSLVGHNPLLIIDADINMHVAGLLGLQNNPERSISQEKNVEWIRDYLRGENDRIDPKHFVKTTPPGTGSNFLTLNDGNPIIKKFATEFAPNSYYCAVGTYEEKDIGASCYHGHLSVFENLLGHAKLNKNEWLVSDMVAGIDAFSNSLHTQFDAIILVIEPTAEGLSVRNQYEELSKIAGVWDRVLIIGNKVENPDDLKFLKDSCGDKLVGVIHNNQKIKNERRAGSKITVELLSEEDKKTLSALKKAAEKLFVPLSVHLDRLNAFHTKFCKVDWVIEAHGDLTNQIDPNYKA